MLASKSNCPLTVERQCPPKVRSLASNDNNTRRLIIKKQADAYKNATADFSQVYDGHDTVPLYTNKCRRNSGTLRLELDNKFSHSPDVKDDEKVFNMASGFESFNQEEGSTYTGSSFPPSLASKSSISDIHLSRKDSPATPKERPVQKHNDVGSKSRALPRNMIRRKKSCPNHRDHEMNLRLSGIMKSPRYSHCKPEDLSRSLQDLDLKVPLADERLTKSMTDLDPQEWSESLDFNNVRFRKNVEVYVYKK